MVMAMQTTNADARETRNRARIGAIVLETSPETPSRVVMNVCPFFRLLLRALCLACNYGSEGKKTRENMGRAEKEMRDAGERERLGKADDKAC